MFKYRAKEIQVPVSDVIAFIDLMHRWPFQTAVKFAYEFYQGNLILSWINGYVPNKDPYVLLSHETSSFYEQNQSYLCKNLDRLVYMRADIEKIEELNPIYRDDVIGHMYDEFPLGRCTAENAAQLAAEILHILQKLYWDFCCAKKQPFPPPSLIRMWLQSDEILHTDLSMPGPKKDWRVPLEKMVPIFKKKMLPIKQSKKSDIDYEYLEKFVTEQKMPDGMRAKDWTVELGFRILQIVNEISNSSLARLVLRVSTSTTKERNAARSAGFRLRGKIIKKYTSPSK